MLQSQVRVSKATIDRLWGKYQDGKRNGCRIDAIGSQIRVNSGRKAG